MSFPCDHGSLLVCLKMLVEAKQCWFCTENHSLFLTNFPFDFFWKFKYHLWLAFRLTFLNCLAALFIILFICSFWNWFIWIGRDSWWLLLHAGRRMIVPLNLFYFWVDNQTRNCFFTLLLIVHLKLETWMFLVHLLEELRDHCTKFDWSYSAFQSVFNWLWMDFNTL